MDARQSGGQDRFSVRSNPFGRLVQSSHDTKHQDHVWVRESEAAADTVASEVPDDNFQPTDAPLPNTSS